MQLMSMEAQTELMKEQQKLTLKAMQEQNEKQALMKFASLPGSFAELAGAKPAM